MHTKFKEPKAEIIIEDGKIIEIRIKKVKGKKPLQNKKLSEFKNFVEKFKEDIVEKWIILNNAVEF